MIYKEMLKHLWLFSLYKQGTIEIYNIIKVKVGKSKRETVLVTLTFGSPSETYWLKVQDRNKLGKCSERAHFMSG